MNRGNEGGNGWGAWPYDYAAAAQIEMRLPDEAPPPPPPSGALVAEARLEVDRIQDLAERAPELLRIAVSPDRSAPPD